MACEGNQVAGIVLGTFFATLALVAAGLGIGYFVWRRKQLKNKQGQNALTNKSSYDNQGFNRDIELSTKNQNGQAGKDIPAAYVEVRERVTSNNNNESARDTDGHIKNKAKRSLFTQSKNSPINRSGSHGSLDGAVTPNYPEVIEVSLQSQDIIGLGFNISGSLSEGIFVSQVHNRGPASESGKVQVGDRILSITISMKNMVYEDALTILSYASPYPVILKLQKALHLLSDDLDMAKLNHPVYRSQSLDDLSKINRDRWTGHRKTWTQIRRQRQTRKDVEDDSDSRDEIEGQLKKWSAAHNIEESNIVQPGDSQSNLSTTDVSLDMDELLSPSSSMFTRAQVLQVEMSDDENELQSKQAESNKKVLGGDRKGQAKTRLKPESESEPEDERIPKGGIAYYVRIDEGLAPPNSSTPFNYDYNPKGIMNKSQLLFSDGTVATTSDPAEMMALRKQQALKEEKDRQKQMMKASSKPVSYTSINGVVNDNEMVDVDLFSNGSSHHLNEMKTHGAYPMHVNTQDSDA